MSRAKVAEATYHQRVSLMRSLANAITQEIKRIGFTAHVWHFASMSTIDFYNERLRRLLEEKIIRSRIYENGLKAEQYAGISTRGSISFLTIHDKDEIAYEGDVPVSMIRPDRPVESFIRATIGGWHPAPLISEVHLHMWDHKPAVHVHIKGSIKVTEADLNQPILFLKRYAKAFRDYIERLNDVSKTFLEEIEVE